MLYSHVIFDLDGTLLNTLEDLARAANHTCELFGWPTFTTDQYRFKVGNGMPKLVERFTPAEFAGDGRVFEKAYRAFTSYYDAHKEDTTAPYPGIIEALEDLRGAGATLAVLSNKNDDAVKPLVERYFGDGPFAVVQGHTERYLPKPDPAITRAVLERLGADPARTLFVGDSDVDVATGHNAGLRVAGAAWGFRGPDELKGAGADYIADEPRSLARLVLS